MRIPLLVAIDGIDGSGKSTIVRRFDDADVTLLKFPDYDTPTGRFIKSGLEGRPPFHQPELLQALLVANRYELAPDIRDLLGAGETVIIDRYFASGIAYGLAEGLDERWLWDIQASLPMPDLYVIVDVPVEASMARRPERRDRFERDAEILRKARKHYLDLWIGNPHVTSWRGQPMAWALVDGTKDPHDVYQLIRVLMERTAETMIGIDEGEDDGLIEGKTPAEWVRDVIESPDGNHLVNEMRRKYGLKD